ncbi:MAG: DUF4139 domain-containing protein [Candidatus Baltobacteraceae bacterium]
MLAFALPLQGSALPVERASTVSARELVNLTVYSGGTALVHDRRRVRLDEGLNRIAWRDVSEQIDATSALLDSPHAPGSLHVLEQNFDYDLLDPQALLRRYVGHTVTVVHDARFAGDRETREPAKILSINGGIVLQYRDRIETQVRGHIIFPASPANFRDKPTLVLDIASGSAGVQTLDLSYLTGGLSWSADYVGVLSADEAHLALTGLVTLSNTSGTGYDGAHLQLVAGNVNIARPPTLPQMRTIASVQSDTYSVNVQQENYFEYHLYTLARPTTIADKQTKQLSLLSAKGIPVKKTLELRGSPSYQSENADLGDRIPVGVYVTFVNAGGDLGIPLPGGTVRLYKADSRGLTQFLGSDTITHTPKNEPVRLHLGDSFDVTARKRQTAYEQSGGCSSTSSYDIIISNAKDAAQDVLVVETIGGDWRIQSENLKHRKSSATSANWLVHAAPDARATLSYSVRVKWC